MDLFCNDEFADFYNFLKARIKAFIMNYYFTNFETKN